MILNYKFENVLSFRESVEFSMEAPGTKVKKRFPNNYIETSSEYNVLKTTVIVGENAGGKSNFVRSLDYFQSFFQDNRKIKAYRRMINSNNATEKCLKEHDSRQKFEIEILCKNKYVYLYQLEIDYWGVICEKLQYKNKRSEKYKLVMKVNRELCEISCGGEQIGNKCESEECDIYGKIGYDLDIPGVERSVEDSLKEVVKKQKNMNLFITKLSILGNEHAMLFSEYISEKLCPETYPMNADIYKALQSEEEDLKILRDPRFLDIFRMVDGSIIQVEIDTEKPFRKSQIVRENQDGNIFKRELEDESSGVSEFFAWAVQIFKVVYEDKIIFADEMDRVLNPILSDKVIAFINGKSHCGQFVFTTHNVLHLSLKNYMKEQIYFITKDNESLESELYSLADFPEIRYETTKIYEFYLKGILGGTASE